MKRTTIIFGVLSALLLISVAVAYAHGSTQERTSTESTERMMMDIEEMDEMHEIMTKGVDPELKEQMDIMHDGCTSKFKKEGNEDYMGQMGGMAGRAIGEMMGSSMMMGGGMMG